MPQLRRNLITGEWVVIAPERAKRPTDYMMAETPKPQSKIECPFCPDGKPHHQLREKIEGLEDDWVFVRPNQYPAFIEDPKKCSVRSHATENFYRSSPSLGGHDILVIKNHDTSLTTFDLPTWNSMFLMIQKRYRYYKDVCNALYTMPIYNHKMAAGASIVHPHAQIFVSNIIPNTVAREMQGSEAYHQKHGRCVFCAINDHESKVKKRLILETPKFIAYTFFAAKFPFEIWILPRKHSCRFEDEDEETIKEFSEAMKEIITKLAKLLHNPPLNFFIHSLPNTLGEAKFYHWHLEIAPRVTNPGGFELGSGIIIDVMSPEKAAEYLNKN